MKNLIVLLDGTWNNADSEGPLTNIGKLRQMIDLRETGGIGQEVYYDAGVGTAGLLDRFIGGLVGRGLVANVLEAYRWISDHYVPGDNVLALGFSRGAFTARSLCGFIGSSGLLKRENCSDEELAAAWKLYRTAPKVRAPAERARLAALCHPDFRVRFLGVFDTVGALGIPRTLLNWVGQEQFEFHDTEVSSIVDHSCHALAIDEKRIEFEAAVWSLPHHRKFKTVEQVWFPGVHSSAGGGCSDCVKLADLTLHWMLSRIRRYCPEFRLQEQPNVGHPHGHIPESRTSPLYRKSLETPLMRLIARSPLASEEQCIPSRWVPNSQTIGEALHWSAIYRFETDPDGYAPLNLLAAFDKAKAGQLPIIGPDGEQVSWQEAVEGFGYRGLEAAE